MVDLGEPSAIASLGPPVHAALAAWLGRGRRFRGLVSIRSPFQKQTRISGSLPGLGALSCKCSRDHEHVRMEGYTVVDGARKLISETVSAYP